MNEPEIKRGPRSERGRDASQRLRSRIAIAKAVIEARLEKNWTQQQLANAASTKQSRISELESIRGNPTLETIDRVALALDLEISLDPIAKKLKAPHPAENSFSTVYVMHSIVAVSPVRTEGDAFESTMPPAVAARMRGGAKPTRCA